MPTCVIDISMHGCRIESRSSFNSDSQLWLYLAHLEAMEVRIIWSRDNFAGIEFSVPLHQAVLDGLLGEAADLDEPDLEQLSDISRRSRWLAGRTSQSEAAQELARLSRDCAASVLVEKLAASDDPEKANGDW